LRIALVDDHPASRAALTLALEYADHDVIDAPDGVTLFTLLGERAPDILISDYRLAKGASGYEVIEAARQAFGADLPALLITGDTDPALIRSMADRGVPVVYKPLQMATLQVAILEATTATASVLVN
jgi:CheY-like chemotaxis protein